MIPELATPGLKSKTSGFKIILIAGIVAGLMDGAAASISVYLATGRGPDVVFTFVASGIFGKEAFGGGTPMAIAGFLFHMMIAMIWAIIFFYLYPILKTILKNNIVVGIVYGAMVWMGMNLIVVPLSNTPPMPSTVAGIIKSMLILMGCIGLPLSLIIGKYYSTHKKGK